MTNKTARYSEEFKAEAVKSIAEHNGNISAAARKLGIPMQTKANQRLFSITRMCAVSEIQPSSYYDWITRGISDQQIHRNHCLLLVKARSY